MKLISMTEFVLEQYEQIQESNVFENNCFKYAKFLKQPLELWMFVPCKLINGVWVVLEEPKKPACDSWGNDFINEKYRTKLEQYQEVKERVLFEGFEYDDQTKQLNNQKGVFLFFTKRYCEIYFSAETQYAETIEDLVKYNLPLTKTAQKQIEL